MARLADNYPAGMSECDRVGMGGGCGTNECSIYAKRECDYCEFESPYKGINLDDIKLNNYYNVIDYNGKYINTIKVVGLDTETIFYESLDCFARCSNNTRTECFVSDFYYKKYLFRYRLNK